MVIGYKSLYLCFVLTLSFINIFVSDTTQKVISTSFNMEVAVNVNVNKHFL